jgi:hypothetical protein
MLAGLLVFLCVTGGAVGFASNEDVEAQQAEPALAMRRCRSATMATQGLTGIRLD